MRSPRAGPRALAVLACAAVTAMLWPATAGALAEPRRSGRNGIDVVQVNGLLDPSNAALIRLSIRDAEREHATVVVFQLDASAAIDVDVDGLLRDVARASVPVAVWVGPSGGGARGAAALLALLAPVAAVAPGAHVGPVLPVRYDHPSTPPAVHGLRGPVLTQRLSGPDAVERRLVDGTQATLGEFIVSLDGRVVHTTNGDVKLSTARVVGEGTQRRRQPNQVVRFRKLDLAQQLAHTLDRPWVAYFLFVAGLALMVFEFFTAGVGIAGLVGAVALVGGGFGFSHLPVEPWAVALLLLGLFGLSVDVQAGGLGFWTFVGAGALVAGSVSLYGGSSRLDPSWWVLVIVCGGTVLFMLSGMTAMVRARFSTPTIGREELVGEIGIAEVDVDPDGIVRVRDASWRARTNRATPISSGDRVRVVSVEGIVLEVEPETGGARDYRDRGQRRGHPDR